MESSGGTPESSGDRVDPPGDSPSSPAGRVRARLATQGRISVADFMAEALYGEGGYYRQERDPVGPKGDFYTSPRVHPAFAVLLAVQIAQVWEAWGRPSRFDACEVGGGHGTLATDLGHAIKDVSPALSAAVRLTVVDWADAKGSEPFERFPAQKGLPPGLQGVVLTNELLDALPIHRILKLGGRIHELCLVPEGESWVEKPFPVETPQLAAWIGAFESEMPEGTIAEVQPAVYGWMRQLASALDRGIAIRTLTLPDRFIDQASPADMYAAAGLGAADISDAVLSALGVAAGRFRAAGA